MTSRPTIAIDRSHTVVAALERMLPIAIIEGGSFASALPPLKSLDFEQRTRIVQAVREVATNICIARAVRHFGCAQPPVGRRPTGDRDWPSGLVGSVTHKGTLILVAVAPRAECNGIGIDLERHLPRDLRPIVGDVAPEGLPSGVPAEVAMTVAFSAKEAAFKAQYPLTGKLLQFSDVELEWGAPAISHYTMSAKVAGLFLAIDAKLINTKWVVSAAQVTAKQ